MADSQSNTCTVQYIDHVGIAVHDLEAALKFFQEVFQIPPGEIKELPEQGVRATLLPVGQTRLELLEPLSADSPMGRFPGATGGRSSSPGSPRRQRRRKSGDSRRQRAGVGGQRTQAGIVWHHRLYSPKVSAWYTYRVGPDSLKTLNLEAALVGAKNLHLAYIFFALQLQRHCGTRIM